MTTLAREINAVQNPALGAVLLWRFAHAYSDAHPLHSRPPLPLFFVLLPMLFDQSTASHIASTQLRSGLRAFAAKFSEARPSQFDLLIQLQGRALRWRSKTREAIRVALATGLMSLDANSSVNPSSKVWQLADQTGSVKRLTACAEKLGAWCSVLSLDEVALALHLRF